MVGTLDGKVVIVAGCGGIGDMLVRTIRGRGRPGLPLISRG